MGGGKQSVTALCIEMSVLKRVYCKECDEMSVFETTRHASGAAIDLRGMQR